MAPTMQHLLLFGGLVALCAVTDATLPKRRITRTTNTNNRDTRRTSDSGSKFACFACQHSTMEPDRVPGCGHTFAGSGLSTVTCSSEQCMKSVSVYGNETVTTRACVDVCEPGHSENQTTTYCCTGSKCNHGSTSPSLTGWLSLLAFFTTLLVISALRQ